MVATTALNPTIGVEVTGVEDLQDEEVIARCTEALKWRGVLVIRGLHLDDEAQLAFCRRLGTVLAPAGPGKEIFTITLDPSKNPAAEYLKGTFFWHIDDTTHATPARSTVLTARHVAMEGGGTQFASTYAAYEALSPEQQQRYEKLRVVHSFEASQRLANPTPTDEQVQAWRRQPGHEVALVWPRADGRKSMVLGATADHVVGMDPAESRALLDELLEFATQPRFSYTHDWQVGDLVVWDNTGILHRALPYDQSSERELHRTTIAGEEAWA